MNGTTGSPKIMTLFAISAPGTLLLLPKRTKSGSTLRAASYLIRLGITSSEAETPILGLPIGQGIRSLLQFRLGRVAGTSDSAKAPRNLRDDLLPASACLCLPVCPYLLSFTQPAHVIPLTDSCAFSNIAQ